MYLLIWEDESITLDFSSVFTHFLFCYYFVCFFPQIRNHLSQIQKYQGQPNAINLNNAESLQMHLETRLSQLDSAISMELWQVNIT